MDCQVSADIHDHFCALKVGNGVCVALSWMSLASLQFAMRLSLLMGGMMGAVVQRLLMRLWVVGSAPGMVTQTV